MTPYQARQIRDFRLRGAGYKAIATVTGLSRDIVRNYCKSHGLEGFAQELTINMKEQIANGMACKNCGRQLLQPHTGRRRRFCSDQCRHEWWTAHSAEIHRSDSAIYHMTCAYCGQDFASYGNRNRKYCCHECYIRDRFGASADGAGLREEETE